MEKELSASICASHVCETRGRFAVGNLNGSFPLRTCLTAGAPGATREKPFVGSKNWLPFCPIPRQWLLWPQMPSQRSSHIIRLLHRRLWITRMQQFFWSPESGICPIHSQQIAPIETQSVKTADRHLQPPANLSSHCTHHNHTHLSMYEYSPQKKPCAVS